MLSPKPGHVGPPTGLNPPLGAPRNHSLPGAPHALPPGTSGWLKTVPAPIGASGRLGIRIGPPPSGPTPSALANQLLPLLPGQPVRLAPSFGASGWLKTLAGPLGASGALSTEPAEGLSGALKTEPAPG